MRVLIACEFSGTVRKEFEALGHEAWSCDLLPSDIPGNHYQGDIRDMLTEHWDLMIAHPPCTYLTISANKWYKDQPPRKSGALVGAERRAARKDAIDFFMMLWNAPIKKIAIENPIGVMNTLLFKPQVVQPYHFGHLESKATCFWLKNLPYLEKTNDVTEEWKKLPKEKAQRLHYLSPSENRWMERSKTFPGIAKALASQYGGICADL